VTEAWSPEAYPSEIRAEIPSYDELQERVVGATRGCSARAVLDLGVGTGETARRLLALHPEATLVAIDGSKAMLSAARNALPTGRVSLRLARLEDPLPTEVFDLVVSVLAVHHLRGAEKAALFRRIADVLRPSGLFVLGDVVVPERPEDAEIPIEAGFDFPDLIADQLTWLTEAGLSAEVVWARHDLAVVRAGVQALV
jgi:tRNA (cmo5U34)-methyltransferase